MQISINKEEVVKTEIETEVKKDVVGSSFSNAEKVPSTWKIEPTEDGIIATNFSTGKVFEGTIEAFNENLRGK